MKNYLASKIKTHWPILTILAVVAILAITNYQPGTFLTGGDNLHPEFNFAANIQRSLFAVWQEYQGLGLLGGMGHATDLLRQLFLLFLSTILPTSILRYFWTFLMLFVGSVGVYILTKSILRRRDPEALLAGIFYLLHLSTIQMFYTPFEAFSAFFGFLPWLLLTTINYLINPNRKSLLFLVLVLILSTPAWYIPTLFVVYLLATGIIALTFTFLQKKTAIIKRTIKLFILVFLINAFWLLPFAYFTFTNSSVTVNAKINQMATEEVFLKNKEFGNIADVVLLKGFWFNNVEPDLSGNYNYMLLPWREHLSNPLIAGIGYLFFAVIVIGVIRGVRERKANSLILVPIFLFAFTMLATETPPFSWVNNIFRQIPLFDQAFRFPFTKFSTLTSLTYAVFLAIGISRLFQLLTSIFKKLPSIFYLLPSILLILFSLPAFQGHLFYDRERLAIPNDYFQLFDFFKTQDQNSRIANFPQHTFWGWNFYWWGYSGSGFLWYGIKQPILDRAFDVWSKTDENYYFELSDALYAKDAARFEQVLNKYQISWLLVDKNVINPPSPKALFFSGLEEVVAKIPNINKAAVFGNIEVYQVALKDNPQNFVFLARDLPTVNGYGWNNNDSAYQNLGNYISTFNFQLSTINYFYPFRSLFSNKPQKDLEFSVKENSDNIELTAELAKLDQATLTIPSFSQEETVLSLAPVIFLNDDILRVEIPKINDSYLTFQPPVTDAKVANCDNFRRGEINFQNNVLSSKNATACLSFYSSTLPHDQAYAIFIDSKNERGRPLHFWIENNTSDASSIDTYLSSEKKLLTNTFILPAQDPQGIGYTLHLENVSIGNEETKNTLEKISVYPIPYNFLTSLVLTSNDQPLITNYQLPFTVSHPNESLYIVNGKWQMPALSEAEGANGKSTLILSQSFDEGWKLYGIRNYELGIRNFLTTVFPFVFGEEVKEHVIVNNWQNGWVISDNELRTKNSKLVIVYLPQYLEYVGFILLGATFLWVGFLFIKKR